MGAARRRGGHRAAAGCGAGDRGTARIRPGTADGKRTRPGQSRRARGECEDGSKPAPALPQARPMGAGGPAGLARGRRHRPGGRAAGRRDPGRHRGRDEHLDRHAVQADPPGHQGLGGHLWAGRGPGAREDHLLPADRRAGDGSAHLRLGGHPAAGRQPAGRTVHAHGSRPAGRAGAGRLHSVGCDGAAGRRCCRPR